MYNSLVHIVLPLKLTIDTALSTDFEGVSFFPNHHFEHQWLKNPGYPESSSLLILLSIPLSPFQRRKIFTSSGDEVSWPNLSHNKIQETHETFQRQNSNYQPQLVLARFQPSTVCQLGQPTRIPPPRVIRSHLIAPGSSLLLPLTPTERISHGASSYPPTTN